MAWVRRKERGYGQEVLRGLKESRDISFVEEWWNMDGWFHG